MNIAIFLPNWIGDVVMATPALRALRNFVAGDARLIGIMRPYVSDVLAGTSWLDEQLFYDPRSRQPELRVGSIIEQLRERQIDIALLLTNSLRTAIIAWLGGATQRIGYACYGRGCLLTTRLRRPRTWWREIPTPALDSYLALAYAMGCPLESPRMELATLPADEQAADEVWRRLALPVDGSVVVLNCSGAYGAAKLWPPEYFAQLARRIAEQLRHNVLVLCGPSERSIAQQIAQDANHPRVKSLADQTLSIGLSKACVRRSRLMVSTDSGPRHIAAAFGIPVVSLFGPTHIAWSDTHYAGELQLQHQVPCGPCSKRTCPLKHHRCMRDLSVDRVYQAVSQQIHTGSQGAPRRAAG